MLRTQKEVFLDRIGDDWYDRNKDDPEDRSRLIERLKRLPFIKPKVIIEVGCGDGRRLMELHKHYPGSVIRGLEPSLKAIEAGHKVAGGVFIDRGTADSLPYPDSCIDLLIYGYCLGYVDPADYFKVAAEGDRVLAEDGWLVIVDCGIHFTHGPQRATAHAFSNYGCFQFRFDYHRLWLSHPAYTLQALWSDGKISVSVLHKNLENAFMRQAFLEDEMAKILRS